MKDIEKKVIQRNETDSNPFGLDEIGNGECPYCGSNQVVETICYSCGAEIIDEETVDKIVQGYDNDGTENGFKK